MTNSYFRKKLSINLLKTFKKNMDNQTKDNIRNQVANARLEQALTAFNNWAATNGDSEMKNQLFLIQSQLSAAKRDENLGLVSSSESRMVRARLANSILSMLDSADNEAPMLTPSPSPTPSQDTSLKPSPPPPSATNVILFLASNPSNTAKLQLDKEFKIVFEKLQNSKFTVKLEWAVTPQAMQKAILKYKPRIIHFSGHGTSSTDSAGTTAATRAIGNAAAMPVGLVLQDDQGNAKVLETKNLAAIFQIFQKFKFQIDAVVLNACHSATQAEAIRNYVNYVVGMSDAIKDEAALEIAESFYDNLSTEDNVELAFDLTKVNVDIEGFSESNLMQLLKRDGL